MRIDIYIEKSLGMLTEWDVTVWSPDGCSNEMREPMLTLIKIQKEILSTREWMEGKRARVNHNRPQRMWRAQRELIKIQKKIFFMCETISNGNDDGLNCCCHCCFWIRKKSRIYFNLSTTTQMLLCFLLSLF